MSIVVLKLPDVKRGREERPRKCPYCEGEIFQRWGQVKKPVRDMHCHQVKVYRYRCCRCRRTFRHYPEGTSRADQSERRMKMRARTVRGYKTWPGMHNGLLLADQPAPSLSPDFANHSSLRHFSNSPTACATNTILTTYSLFSGLCYTDI